MLGLFFTEVLDISAVNFNKLLLVNVLRHPGLLEKTPGLKILYLCGFYRFLHFKILVPAAAAGICPVLNNMYLNNLLENFGILQTFYHFFVLCLFFILYL